MIVTIVVSVFVVFAVALFEIKPLLKEISRWRARRYATKAEIDLTAENWEAAQLKAQLAYRLRPDEPAAVRAVARLQSLTGNSKLALQFWDLLDDAKAMTVQDRRMRAEDLLRTGGLEDARREVERLLAESPSDPANLRLGAKWAATEKRFAQAMDFALRAQQLDPDNQQGKLLLGLLQCEAPRNGARETGLRTLFELVEDRGKPGLEALTFLANQRDHSPEKIALIVERLRSHPLASENHQLLAIELELAAHPDEREKVLDEALERYRAAPPAAQRTFGVWLNSKKEYERTLKIIPVEEAMKRKDFLLVTLDAMAQQKRWTEIQEILQGKGVPLDEIYAELFLARSAMELGQTTSADLHWRRAHVAAAPSVDNMWFLANYAEKIGQTDHAEKAFRSLTSNSATARPAYEGLLRMAEKRHDTVAIYDLLTEMSKRWPKDNSVRNDYVYFGLLRRDRLDEGLKAARQLVDETPGSLAHRTTLALAHLRLNDPTAALAVYRNLNIPWDKSSSSYRAVYAAVLGANGREDEARTHAGAVKLESLRPEERELIAPWRAQ